LASLVNSIVIGVTAFFLAFPGFSAFYEPIIPSKPWASMEWDSTMVIRIAAARTASILTINTNMVNFRIIK